MIYFDSTYVAKVYLLEHGSAEVRALTTTQPEVACSEIGKVELASVLHRKLREGALDVAFPVTFPGERLRKRVNGQMN